MRGDFQVVTHPEKAPAVDFITRSSVGPFIDTGVDVLLRPQPGMQAITERVYLAESTITQLASLFGITGDSQNFLAREAHLIAQGKLEGLKEELGGRLVDVVRDLARIADVLS